MMHIPRRQSCQRFVSGALAGLSLAGVLFGKMAAPGRTAPAAAPATPTSPTPAPAATAPAWQRDLNAVAALQLAAAMGAPKDAAALQQQQDRLLKLYTDLGTKYPDENEVQRAAGDYCAQIGRQDLAIPYWERAEKIDPKDGVSAEALGSAALSRGDVREARDQFQHAVDARPEEALYHYSLANVLYLFRHDLANPPGAVGSEAEMVASLEQFRLAANLAPLDAVLAEAYAETFYMLARPDWSGALAAWDKVRVLNALNPDLANCHLARVSLHLGQPDAAEKYLDAIRDPRFAALKAKLRAQAEALRQK